LTCGRIFRFRNNADNGPEQVANFNVAQKLFSRIASANNRPVAFASGHPRFPARIGPKPRNRSRARHQRQM
jgi:hypothetical protein